MSNLNKTIMISSVLFFIFLFTSLENNASFLYAAKNLQITNQERKLKQMEIHKQEIQFHLQESYNSEQNVLSLKKRLSKNIEELKEKIVQTIQKQEQTEAVLIRQSKEIERLKQNINQHEQAIRKRIRSIYSFLKGKQVLLIEGIDFDYSPKNIRLTQILLQHEIKKLQKIKIKYKALDKLLRPYQNRKLIHAQLHQDNLIMKHQLELKEQKYQQLIVNIQQDRQIYYQYLDELQQKMETTTEVLEHFQLQKNLASSFKNPKGLWPLKGKIRIPLEGKIVSLEQKNGKNLLLKRGILIENSIPSYISAIAPGKIVYADYLEGYLLLVIIDHSKSSYSVYGKLDELKVEVGNFVDTNTRIGKVAFDPTFSSYRAYFEIRYKGNRLDPLKWIMLGDLQ